MKEEEQSILDVLDNKSKSALIFGDCASILDLMPSDSIDCAVTSPPYWNMRDYDIPDCDRTALIGVENDPTEYVNKLTAIFSKVRRVLKPSGSLWLNLGDKYHDKNLMGIPWRVAISLQNDGWILRNDVIWEKLKGTQSSKDRLRMIHEHLFHFVKRKKYYYDRDSILIKPSKIPSFYNGSVVSATGVSGKKYRRQIEESPWLTEEEKQAATQALENTLQKMRDTEIVDFRMTIRGQQRTLHSNSKKVSGRARELQDKGFFILQSHSKGFVPSDVWRIVPEDVVREDDHYAVFPVDLLEVPIKATCPKDGVVLDPFMGTGSAVVAALTFERRGIGIEVCKKYVDIATLRVNEFLSSMPSSVQLTIDSY